MIRSGRDDVWNSLGGDVTQEPRSRRTRNFSSDREREAYEQRLNAPGSFRHTEVRHINPVGRPEYAPTRRYRIVLMSVAVLAVAILAWVMIDYLTSTQSEGGIRPNPTRTPDPAPRTPDL